MGIILYRILKGYFPFQAETCKELFELIKKGEYTTNAKLTPALSNCCLEFIDSMLQVDPAKRITTVQISNHRWITGDIQEM